MPDDTNVLGLGCRWKNAGTYQAASGTLVVTLSDNADGRVTADAIYLLEVPAAADYQQTTYAYEDYPADGVQKGRLDRVVAADGTITRYVYDARGNVASTWIGTNDDDASYSDPTGTDPVTHIRNANNNMAVVSSSTYDADGNVLTSTTYADDLNQSYTTTYQYDFRDRLTDVLTSADVVTHYDYDNLGRVTWTKTYASDDFTLDADELRAEAENFYDARGRVYETRVYEVSSTGTASDYLPSYTWYDAAGRVIKTSTANGLFQKYSYDGLGRLVASYTCYDADETASDLYGNVHGQLDLGDDTVIEQSRTWYNDAGQVVMSATYERFPGDTTSAGALDAADSYVTASVTWYDGLGRTIATANYGREDTASGLAHSIFDGTTGALIDANANGIANVAEAAPPATYNANTSDASGDSYIVSLYQYDSAGRAYRTIDNFGRINETQYDDAGRVIRTIQNYANGTVEETDTAQDITVEYQYDSAGRLVTMIAYNAKGDDNNANNNVESQATKYLYESTVNASWQTAVVYPDSGDNISQNAAGDWVFGTGGNTDHTSTTYDRLGRKVTTTDQRGVEHMYVYDTAGRVSEDLVLSLGGSNIVDDTVLRIDTDYDDLGRVESVTSYRDTTATMPANQVKYAYDGWGNLAAERQAHDGLVATGTPEVEYVYADGAVSGVAKFVRLTDVVYPGEDRAVGYDYAAGIDDIMSRLSSIFDDADSDGVRDSGETIDASYKYLGAGTIVEEDYVQSHTKLTYLDSSGNVAGLDRFGRVVDQLWEDYSTTPATKLDEYTYTYDRAGNRTSKTNELNHNLDETNEYDALDRLIEWFVDGTSQQTWTLDSLGNDLASGTYNVANEETPTQGSSGYDASGNMTTLKSGKTAKYDAWNHLVEVDDGATIIEKYEYDGRGRRIQIFSDFDGTTPEKIVDDYLSGQQVIESAVTVDGNHAGGYQYLWSPRYIDAPILRDTLNTAGTGIVQAQRVFYLADANYNVTGLVKYDSGAGRWNVAERYTYTPYGEVTYRDAATWNDVGSSANANTALYTGRTLDLLTSLYFYRARWYEPAIYRFINRFPMGYRGKDFNLYGYAADTPVSGQGRLGRISTSDPFYPFSRSDAQCCQAAADSGLLAGASRVICCDGRLIPCASPELNTMYRNSTAQGIIAACAVEHETVHINQGCTVNCTLGEVKPTLPTTPSLFNINEASAHIHEMACLIKHVDQCGLDMECRQQVLARYDVVRLWYIEYLKKIVEEIKQHANVCEH